MHDSEGCRRFNIHAIRPVLERPPVNAGNELHPFGCRDGATPGCCPGAYRVSPIPHEMVHDGPGTSRPDGDINQICKPMQ